MADQSESLNKFLETLLRVHPFYDVIKKFSKESEDWSVDAWVVALCRFKGEVILGD